MTIPKNVLPLLLLGLLAGKTFAQTTPGVITTVYPVGSFPLDVQHVQAAVDLGGTVILKATNTAGQPTAFDFGPAAPHTALGVNITRDVSILGEQIGQIATTIKGGSIPILGIAPVKSKIQGIHFEGPLDTAIALIRSTGAEITGNHFSGNVPVPLFFGFTEVEGIFVSGADDPQNAITGRIRIADNVIELSAGDFANGMQFDEVAADIEVNRNTVKFLQSNGIIQTIGILVFRSHGKADVVENRVMMGPGDPGAFPSGIFIGGHAEARYRISRNTVITDHPNSDGIDVLGLSFSGPTLGAMIEGNHVVTHSTILGSGGVSVVGGVQNSEIEANQIEGTSGNAVQLFGLGSALTAESNHVVGNDISQLLALDVDVFFGPDSVDNLFAGNCNTFVDLGIGNHILCGVPTGSAVSATRGIANRRRLMNDKLGDDIRRARLDALRSRLTP